MPLCPPNVAVMVLVPAATAVTRPVELTVATVGADEVQAEVDVMLVMVASPYSAVALNCSEVPTCNYQLVEGEMPIAVSAVVMTVRLLDPVTPLKVALILVVPAPTAVTRPMVGVTVAMAVSAEVQVACWVRYCWLPSE